MNFQPLIKYPVLTFIFVFVSINFAQTKRWISLDKNEVKETFIDTTSIKVTDDQLSVWVLDIYEQPEEINDDGLKAKRARTQYLFNVAQNTYSVIGNLYYDEVGKIISQQYNPRIGGVGRSFSQNVDGNPIVNTLYTNLTNYLNIAVQRPELNLSTSNRSEQLKDFQDKSLTLDYDRIDDVIQKNLSDENTDDKDLSENPEELISEKNIIEPVQQTIEFDKNPKADENIGNPRDAVDEDMPTKINRYKNQSSSARVAKIYDPVTGDYVELRAKISEVPKPVEIDLSNYEYNPYNETQVTNTIFTDGEVFCFQVSSWKRKSIADNEVRKLKQKGHNAFVVAANPKHKRGTWYRVRVGYFNSREETEAYRNKI